MCSSDLCRLEFALDGDGRPTYAIRYGDRDVVRPSTLGFETDAGDLTRGFRIVGSATAARHEVWRPVWGEEEEIADDHDELLVELEQAETGRRLNVRFCVFADGVGFRYEFPEQGNRLAYFKIKEERTRFNLPGDPTAWWIPADYDTQEYRFFTSRCSEIPCLYATRTTRTSRRIRRRSSSSGGADGGTWQRRIELYLLDCGVTEAEIAAFKSIMLE